MDSDLNAVVMEVEETSAKSTEVKKEKKKTEKTFAIPTKEKKHVSNSNVGVVETEGTSAKLTEKKKENLLGPVLLSTAKLNDFFSSKDTLKLTQKRRPQNEDAGNEHRHSEKSVISQFGMILNRPGTILVGSPKSSSSEISISTTSSKSSEIGFFDEYGEEISEEVSEEEKTKTSDKESLDSSDQQYEHVSFGHLIEFINNIPDISDISSGFSEMDIKNVSKVISKVKSVLDADLGKFVNPLTGIASSSSTLSTEIIGTSGKFEEGFMESEEQEEEQNEFGMTEIREDEDLLNMLVELCEKEVEEVVPVKKDDDGDDLEAFLHEIVIDEYDEKEAEREEEQRQLKMAMHKIIDDLISQVILKAEALNAKLLREKLDKRKIMTAIAKAIDELYVEKKVGSFLNRKCVEFFKRKQMYKCLEDTQTLQNIQQRVKYKNSLQEFDQNLGEEKSKKAIFDYAIKGLKEMVNENELDANTELNNLEDLANKSILSRRSTPRLEALVNKMLRDMNNKRDEISKVRQLLFMKSYTTAELQKELQKMESLGGRGQGYTVVKYEELQNDVSILEKKLEERNHEMETYRHSFQSLVHGFSHIRDTEKMLLDRLINAKKNLRDLNLKKFDLRNHIVQKKVYHDQIRRTLKKTSNDAGLRDKAALMKDYDEAIVHIKELKAKVEPLRAKYAKIEEMIETIRFYK